LQTISTSSSVCPQLFFFFFFFFGVEQSDAVGQKTVIRKNARGDCISQQRMQKNHFTYPAVSIILASTNPGAPRAPLTLKATNIGMFEPTGMPDAAAAILFIDNFNDAVKQYGEDRVLLIMKRCCNNAIALSWLTSLSEADRGELLTSITAWERFLRRDFMPKLADLESKAKEEIFKWSQNRTPSQYVSDKIKLLKIVGITNSDAVVYELHKGFHRCPELQIPLTQAVKEPGNDLAHYRREVLNYQDMARMQYEFNHRPSISYAPRTRERPLAGPTGSIADSNIKRQVSNPFPPAPLRKDRTRKRKCRNFPTCGDGEHWDWECKVKPSARDTKKRAYYAARDEEAELCRPRTIVDPRRSAAGASFQEDTTLASGGRTLPGSVIGHVGQSSPPARFSSFARTMIAFLKASRSRSRSSIPKMSSC
jgi:hypothetical protein